MANGSLHGITISSQRTQIIRHIAELPDHLGVAEIARGRITRAAECDGTKVAFPCAITPQRASQQRWD
jgi:hypothetical protein